MSKRRRKSTIENDALDGLFGLGETDDSDQSAAPPVRPARAERQLAKPKTKQMSALLYESQIAWLQATVEKIKRNGGTTFRKANVLRAFIDAAIESDLSLKNVASEDDLKAALVKAIKKQE